MRRFLKPIGVPILVLFLLALTNCTLLEKRAQQRKARQGLESLVAQDLPNLDQFELVKTVSLDFSMTAYGMTCYYARDYLIMGTSLPESEALEHYVEGLLPLSWTKEGEQYLTSKILIHGQNARIVVSHGEPGVDVDDAVDFERLSDIYQSILFVRVDYMLPARDGC